MFAMPSPRPMDGEGTANTDYQTRNPIAVLGVSELIQYLRLPPRAPYETGESLSLFLPVDRMSDRYLTRVPLRYIIKEKKSQYFR